MRNDDFTMSAIAKLSLSIFVLIFGKDMVVAECDRNDSSGNRNQMRTADFNTKVNYFKWYHRMKRAGLAVGQCG